MDAGHRHPSVRDGARPVSPQPPVTKGEFIRLAIQDDILSGRLRPGDPIKLDEQAARFGATPIPVREALRALQAERLVTIRPHQTAVVAAVDLEELEDIYGVRDAIEAEVMRRAAARAEAGSIARLRGLALEHERSLRGGRPRSEAHRRFHFHLYELAGSPTLARIAADLWNSSERCRRVLREAPAAPSGRQPDDHLALVEALQAGSAERAAATMRRHLARSIAALRAAFARDRETAR